MSDHFQLCGNSPNEAYLGVSCNRKSYLGSTKYEVMASELSSTSSRLSCSNEESSNDEQELVQDFYSQSESLCVCVRVCLCMCTRRGGSRVR